MEKLQKLYEKKIDLEFEVSEFEKNRGKFDGIDSNQINDTYDFLKRELEKTYSEIETAVQEYLTEDRMKAEEKAQKLHLAKRYLLSENIIEMLRDMKSGEDVPEIDEQIKELENFRESYVRDEEALEEAQKIIEQELEREQGE